VFAIALPTKLSIIAVFTSRYISTMKVLGLIALLASLVAFVLSEDEVVTYPDNDEYVAEQVEYDEVDDSYLKNGKYVDEDYLPRGFRGKEMYGQKDKDYKEKEYYKCSLPSYVIEADQVSLSKEVWPLCSAREPEGVLYPCVGSIEGEDPVILTTQVSMCSGRPLLLQTSLTSDISIDLGVRTDLEFENLFADYIYEASGEVVITLKKLSADCEGEFSTETIEDINLISRKHTLTNEIFMDDHYFESFSSKVSYSSYYDKYPYPYDPKTTTMVSLFQQYQDTPSLIHVFTPLSQDEVVCNFTWEFELSVEASALCNEEITTEDKAFAAARLHTLGIMVTTSG